MASLKKCDKCGNIDDASKFVRVRILLPGDSYKSERTFDLDHECVKVYLKSAEPLMLR